MHPYVSGVSEPILIFTCHHFHFLKSYKGIKLLEILLFKKGREYKADCFRKLVLATALPSAKVAEVNHHPQLHHDEEPNGKEGGHEDKP